MLTVPEIYQLLKNESSTNGKIQILKDNSDNELLKRVLYLTYSPRIKFYIKTIPETIKKDQSLSLKDGIEKLDTIYTREKTGHDALNFILDILSKLSVEDESILRSIIAKDGRVGIGETVTNKVFPKLIEETPYMGCKSYDIKLVEKLFSTGKVYSQIKMDGRYCNGIISDSGDVYLESRQGETTFLDGAKFIDELKPFYGYVLNGELTIPNISRVVSNGIISSLVSIGKKRYNNTDVSDDIKDFEAKYGSIQESLDSIVYTVWDIISLEEYQAGYSDIPYYKRLDTLISILDNSVTTSVKLIDYVICDSIEAVHNHFKSLIADGHEGTCLKAYNGKWKDGKPNWQVKFKLEMNVDLEIIDFNLGTGKNANLVSSINCKSSDGLLLTSPAGITEADMKYITENQRDLVGSIVEVKCSGVSYDHTGAYSLLHPVFKKLRDDKKVADSLEQIIQNENMVKGIKN